MLALALCLLSAAPTDGVPAAARARYQDAVTRLNARQYGPANDVLNALAAENPRVAEVFASRCSAQLGLQHWAAAEADCAYTLALKQLPTAVYGLAVAEDGQGKYAQAIGHYRQYAGLLDATAQLKAAALTRADLLAAQTPAAAPAAPPPSRKEKVAKKEEPDVAPPPPPPPTKPAESVAPPPPPPPNTATATPVSAPPPPGGGKGQFVPGIPDPNEGLVYVYRNTIMGVGTGTTVFVDRVRIGELWNDHYFEVRLKPGNHDITIKAAVPSGRKPPEFTLPVEVSEGTVTYVKLEYAPSPDDVGFKPVQIGKEGRKEIRADCELVYSKKL